LLKFHFGPKAGLLHRLSHPCKATQATTIEEVVVVVVVEVVVGVAVEANQKAKMRKSSLSSYV